MTFPDHHEDAPRTNYERTPAAGETWSKVPDPSGLFADNPLRALTAWNGEYVAVGESERNGGRSVVLTSTDAVHWRLSASLDGIAWDVIAHPRWDDRLKPPTPTAQSFARR
jgi:hypothetical protein